ncbi:hypothetical protein B0T16DRAFT_455712 [Cercophora newfieldiana]|uniref:Uncharacterized protein n=1 Tax=Cercophora newfieldiana TaxID=92897 RepID=A0AA39Y8X5_9PEZI|nr:hypothetical protein B0T16DRAFT_455712 [Cercophora newfieldiana]
MTKLLLPALSLLLSPILASAVPQGQIYALQYPTIPADPKDAITVGCINAAGALTLTDCSLFSHIEGSIGTFSSAQGNCTFLDSSTPAHPSERYGEGSHAWKCGGTTSETDANPVEFYYLMRVSGWTDGYAVIGNGNLHLFYDVPSLPTTKEDEIPVWRYLWDLPEGHERVALLWVPKPVEG